MGKSSSFEARDVREAIANFQDFLLQEMEQYLMQQGSCLFASGNLHSLSDVNLISKMKGKEFNDALHLMCNAILKIKKGNNIIKNSRQVFEKCDKILSFMKTVTHCNLMSRMFQLAMCVSVWQRIGKDDLSILMEMGFKEAAAEIIEKEVKEKQLTTKKVAASPKCKQSRSRSSGVCNI